MNRKEYDEVQQIICHHNQTLIHHAILVIFLSATNTTPSIHLASRINVIFGSLAFFCIIEHQLAKNNLYLSLLRSSGIIGYDNLFIYCSIDIINQEKMLHYKMVNIILLLLISLRGFTLIVDAIFFSLCLYLRA